MTELFIAQVQQQKPQLCSPEQSSLQAAATTCSWAEAHLELLQQQGLGSQLHHLDVVMIVLLEQHLEQAH